jgi:hypothetical protein
VKEEPYPPHSQKTCKEELKLLPSPLITSNDNRQQFIRLSGPLNNSNIAQNKETPMRKAIQPVTRSAAKREKSDHERTSKVVGCVMLQKNSALKLTGKGLLHDAPYHY